MKKLNKYQSKNRRFFNLLPALVLFLAGLVSCDDEESNPYIHINPFEAIQISNNGAEVLLTVDANVDWTFNTDENWVTGTVTAEGIMLKADPNSNGSSRRALLRIVSTEYPIANKLLSVVQGATFLEIKPAFVPQLKADGVSVNIAVETNAEDWKVSVTEGDWLTVAQSATGFTLTAPKNEGRTSRTAVLTVGSVRYEQEQTLEITQGANFVPYLSVTPAGNQNIPSAGGNTTLTVDTNVDDWECVSDNTWLTVEKSAGAVKISSNKYYGTSRTATLTFSSATYPALNTQVQVSQTGSTYTVTSNLFTDDFSWVGNAFTGSTSKDACSPVLTTTTNESQFSNWASFFGTTNGWTSTATLNGSTTSPWIYSRYQYCKFGRANNSADIISPKITVTGTKTVLVSFKAVAYANGETNKDFTLTVTGGGEIQAVVKTGKDNAGVDCFGEVTPQGAHFVIGNYWVTNAATNWGDEYAVRSFIITGFTSNTQIHFIGDESYQARAITGNRRYGFDDVVIDIIE
jgi:hypothetical protein